MKKLKFFMKVSLLGLLLLIGFNGYSQAAAPACCTATCANGSCTAYIIPCSCSCSFWGNPDCGGGLKTLSIGAMQASNISSCINYLNILNTSHSTSAATHLGNYKNAVAGNNQTLAAQELDLYVTKCENLTGREQNNYKQFVLTLPKP